MKFGALLGRARHLYGCAAVATGHYARVEASEDAGRPGGRRYRLLAGRDPDKDQSYFLYGLTQAQLAATRFPLGELTKAESREVARRHGLVTADKPESQEICFVREGDYRAELARRVDRPLSPGPLVDADGVRVGEHAGAAAYTVGQRSGLGVALGERQYVAAIDASANLIRLGRREDLELRRFTVGETLASSTGRPAGAFDARVRIRHRARARRGARQPQRRRGRRAGAWSSSDRPGRRRPGRRRSSTTAMPSSAAAASWPAGRHGRRLRRRRGSARMSDGLATVLLEPAFVLSLLVGSFHTCVYVFVRGKLGWHLPPSWWRPSWVPWPGRPSAPASATSSSWVTTACCGPRPCHGSASASRSSAARSWPASRSRRTPGGEVRSRQD